MSIQLFKPEINYQAILPELQEIMEKGWIGLGAKTNNLKMNSRRESGQDTL